MASHFIWYSVVKLFHIWSKLWISHSMNMETKKTWGHCWVWLFGYGHVWVWVDLWCSISMYTRFLARSSVHILQWQASCGGALSLCSDTVSGSHQVWESKGVHQCRAYTEFISIINPWQWWWIECRKTAYLCTVAAERFWTKCNISLWDSILTSN